MRGVEFGDELAIGTRLTLSSDDKPDRFFSHQVLDGRNVGHLPYPIFPYYKILKDATWRESELPMFSHYFLNGKLI